MNIAKIAVILVGCLILFASWKYFTALPTVEDFSDAKYALENYVVHDHRVTIYCNAEFDKDKRIQLPPGFETGSHPKRAERVEWEHAVPAENFGRAFKSWREGHKRCVKNGQPYKGRKCARKVSEAFRKIEADMYNLFPAIGAVNARRRNYDYAELPDEDAAFGSCAARIGKRSFEPPNSAKGQLARASLYMDAQYSEFRLSRQQKKLFTAWDRLYPVDKWECTRTRRIEKIQGNENMFVKKPCQAAGLW